MKYLDWTLPTPAENLAADEALLRQCESDGALRLLRFWMPTDHFVVLGYGDRAAVEVRLERCAARGVPVLRRWTGGGAVLQGPGCLNYTLVMPVDAHPALRSISATNDFVMERHRAALAGLSALPVERQGHTDLAIAGRKCAGNAQRRLRRSVLFHGAFLLDLDLRLVEELLPLPSRAPAYRQNRAHRDFLRNLALPANALKQALRETWQATEPLLEPPRRATAELARARYAAPEWTFKR